jgi:hypothetical protein
MRRLLHLAVIALVAALLAPAALSAQLVTAPAKGKRLILKDGDYHLVREWEVKGDRVRFYSTERRDWEEMPLELVDLEATKKYEERRGTAGVSPEVEQLSAEEEAERRAEEARTPEVAPGIRLPATGGVYLLDTFRGEAQLVEMVQSGSDIHKETGRNILRAAINPFARAKQSIRLPGLKARIQAHDPDPMLFINIDADEESPPAGTAQEASEAPTALDAWAQRFRIAKLERKNKDRIVGNLKIAFTGSVKQEHQWVETRVEPVSGGWLRLTPAVPLEPGEYALIEMLGKNQFNLYVWDFGVDPAAPQNPSAWKPVQPKPNLTGTSETLILKDQRPRK